MSIHIGAKKGQIAEAVLLPGDPLRAQYLAETYLENPECYNQVRGMLGFTGTYNGKKVSVQGAGHDSPGGYRADRGHHVQGLTILTVSDSLVTMKIASSEQRQQGYTAMMEIALRVATS